MRYLWGRTTFFEAEMIRFAIMLLILLMIGVPHASAERARVKLSVTKSSYAIYSWVQDPEEPHDGITQPPYMIDNCGDPPVFDNWCGIEDFKLATVDCAILTTQDTLNSKNALQLEMTSKTSGDNSSAYHEVDNDECIAKIECAYGGGHTPVGELKNVVNVPLASGAWCINSTSEIVCHSSRTGCSTDGYGCTYKLSCTHRDS